MAECFIVRKGSSGGLAGELYAAIGVTYPEDSICTCTNESTGVVLTDDDTTGQVVFNIPEASTWTITSTDPADATKTKSQSVSITTEGQCESVKLTYRLYLYDNGTKNVEWNKGGSSYGSGTVTYNSDHVSISNSGYPTWLSTSEKLSRGEYTKLGMTTVLSSNPGSGVRFGIASNIVDFSKNESYIANNLLTTSGEQTTFIDISSVSEEFYVVIFTYYNSGTTQIKAVWFE